MCAVKEDRWMAMTELTGTYTRRARYMRYVTVPLYGAVVTGPFRTPLPRAGFHRYRGYFGWSAFRLGRGADTNLADIHVSANQDEAICEERR